MSEAMNAILGEAKWEGIKNWNEEYIKDYEQRTGHILPSIPVYAKGTKDVVGRSKQSSMKHVLGVMVKWAALSQEDDPEFTENSLREEFEVRIVTGEVYHPSLPPDYPVALIDKLLQKQSPS